MTGKHYQWHKRWALNASDRTATHDSGLTVRYLTEAQMAGFPPAELGGQCRTDNGEVWHVLHIGGDAALSAWLQDQAAHGLRDADSIRARLARLMREAGDLWVHHQHQRGHQ